MRNTFPSRNIRGGHSFILYANSSLTEGKGNTYIYIYFSFLSSFFFRTMTERRISFGRYFGRWSVIRAARQVKRKVSLGVQGFSTSWTRPRGSLKPLLSLKAGRRPFSPRSWDPFRVGFPKRQPARVGQSLSPMFLRRWMAICHSILVRRFSKLLSPFFL